MHRATCVVVAAGLALGSAISLSAQAASQEARGARDKPPTPSDLGDAVRRRDARYQIGQMERLLEGAVEHGATLIRDRLRALMPADMLLAENARARGFRLDGYGMFFDVEVPTLEGTLPWSFRTLDQNDLGIENALRTLRSFIEVSASNDVNLQQAFKRVELQVAPIPPTPTTPGVVVATPTSDARILTSAPPAAAPIRNDPILDNPNEAYRVQVREALVDAMLDHSRGLHLGPTEWLTVAARRADDRPRLASADSDARTVIIRLSGADLTAFLAGQISRDDARSKVEIREF